MALEYFHVYIAAIEIEDEDDDVESPYPFNRIQSELNRLGRDDWDLVTMTPNWVWGAESIEIQHRSSTTSFDSEAPFSVPDYIAGWYCTFKRVL